MDSKKIIEAVVAVTGRWAKQRKAEERNAQNAVRRHYALLRSTRTTIKEAAWEVMPTAYLQASSDNTLPAHARQVMYAARGHIQQVTGEVLDDHCFTQTLLPNYLLENPDTTADWDVVFDARGHFAEPHTDVVIPLGTMDVREYLRRISGQDHETKDPPRRPAPFRTVGATNRFGAVLFIEKVSCPCSGGPSSPNASTSPSCRPRACRSLRPAGWSTSCPGRASPAWPCGTSTRPGSPSCIR